MENVKHTERQNNIMNSSIFKTCLINYQLVASLVLYEYSFTHLDYFEANIWDDVSFNLYTLKYVHLYLILNINHNTFKI